jgi:hypothetical protein
VVLKISAYLKTIGIAGFKGLVFQGHSGAFYWFKPHLQWENRGFPVKIFPATKPWVTHVETIG